MPSGQGYRFSGQTTRCDGGGETEKAADKSRLTASTAPDKDGKAGRLEVLVL